MCFVASKILGYCLLVKTRENTSARFLNICQSPFQFLYQQYGMKNYNCRQRCCQDEVQQVNFKHLLQQVYFHLFTYLFSDLFISQPFCRFVCLLHSIVNSTVNVFFRLSHFIDSFWLFAHLVVCSLFNLFIVFKCSFAHYFLRLFSAPKNKGCARALCHCDSIAAHCFKRNRYNRQNKGINRKEVCFNSYN